VLLLLLLAGCSVLVRYSVMLLHLTVTFLLAEGPEEDVFVGRAAELARLADVVARVRRGQPWLVTIEGESGVGKTALARRSLAWPAGLRVLWARG
jgi:ABC-type glutathione transport system ATPase component